MALAVRSPASAAFTSSKVLAMHLLNWLQAKCVVLRSDPLCTGNRWQEWHHAHHAHVWWSGQTSELADAFPGSELHSSAVQANLLGQHMQPSECCSCCCCCRWQQWCQTHSIGLQLSRYLLYAAGLSMTAQLDLWPRTTVAGQTSSLPRYNCCCAQQTVVKHQLCVQSLSQAQLNVNGASGDCR
jgi:hypothetical protein